MAKNETLSTDMNFIKEFEELKLKQRLLIETLKRKSKLSHDTAIENLDNKLDFLVKIFTEANSLTPEKDKEKEEKKTEETKNPEEEEKKHTDVLDMLDSIEKLIGEKFKSIEDRLITIETSLNPSSGDEASLDDNAFQDDSFSSEEQSETNVGETSSENETAQSQTESTDSLPPPPTFEVDPSKIDNLSQDQAPAPQEKKKEKKKWF